METSNDERRLMKLVFLGPPGAGKGTIAAIARQRFGIVHISTGDLFREAIRNETALGLKVKAILAAGDLVPDSVTIDMVRERISKEDCRKGFILDGFPRTVAQADALAEMAEPDAVFNFQLPEEVVVQRLSGRRMCKSTGRIYHVVFNPPKVEGKDDDTGEDLMQRPDDMPDAIRNRLAVYEKSTAPLVSYYRGKRLIIDIDASPSPEEVFASMDAALRGL